MHAFWAGFNDTIMVEWSLHVVVSWARFSLEDWKHDNTNHRDRSTPLPLNRSSPMTILAHIHHVMNACTDAQSCCEACKQAEQVGVLLRIYNSDHPIPANFFHMHRSVIATTVGWSVMILHAAAIHHSQFLANEDLMTEWVLWQSLSFLTLGRKLPSSTIVKTQTLQHLLTIASATSGWHFFHPYHRQYSCITSTTAAEWNVFLPPRTTSECLWQQEASNL